MNASESSSTAGVRRVVFSGGPAAGKTAILDVIRRHLEDRVVVLPESATLLFQGGFPRPDSESGRRLVQQAIYSVQHTCEELFALEHAGSIQICDRGTLDGAAYWPGGLELFLGAMGTTVESEFRRYDAVIFLETCAYDPEAYPVENPYRKESPEQARDIDRALQEIWSGHPNYQLIGYEKRFYEKVAAVLFALHRALDIDGDSVPGASPS